MRKMPHPPGTEIAVHTVDALNRIITFIETNEEVFKKEVREAEECLELLRRVRNGRIMERGGKP